MAHLNDWLISIQQLPSAILPFAVLGLALLGSPHCLMMCGPLCMASGTKNRRGLFLYHFGRLVAYVSIGALFGYFGEIVLQESRSEIFTVIALLLAITFIVTGSSLFFSQRAKKINFMSGPLVRLLSKIAKLNQNLRALFFGMASGLLPCGFLYTFVLAAVATKSWVMGGSLLFAFWLGTVPALSLSIYLVKKLQARGSKRLNQSLRFALAGVFVVYGVTLFANRLQSLMVEKTSTEAAAPMSCHEHDVTKHDATEHH